MAKAAAGVVVGEDPGWCGWVGNIPGEVDTFGGGCGGCAVPIKAVVALWWWWWCAVRDSVKAMEAAAAAAVATSSFSLVTRSSCFFRALLSLARRFWNQILTCVGGIEGEVVRHMANSVEVSLSLPLSLPLTFWLIPRAIERRTCIHLSLSLGGCLCGVCHLSAFSLLQFFCFP